MTDFLLLETGFDFLLLEDAESLLILDESGTDGVCLPAMDASIPTTASGGLLPIPAASGPLDRLGVPCGA